MMEKSKIKFPVNSKPEFIQELRENVKLYFEKNNISMYGNATMVFKTIFMMLLYLIPFVLMLAGVIHTLPMLFLCWGIMGLGTAGIGMGCMHDGGHRTYSKNQLVNKIFASTLYLLGGTPAIWRHQHNTLHHGYTNIDGHDEDITPGGFLRFSPNQPLHKIHRLQHFYAWFFYSIMTISWITIKEFRQFYRYKKENVAFSNMSYRGLFVELVVSKIIYYLIFLVLPMIILPFNWPAVLLAFLFMHLLSGLILTTIFQTAHVVPSSEYPLPDNTGSMKNNWAIHQLLTTADFSPNSRIIFWLFGGLNFQVVHHLFPNISHVHYRKLSVLVKQAAEKYELPYHVQPSFLRAVRSHFIMLRELGRKPILSGLLVGA